MAYESAEAVPAAVTREDPAAVGRQFSRASVLWRKPLPATPASEPATCRWRPPTAGNSGVTGTHR